MLPLHHTRLNRVWFPIGWSWPGKLEPMRTGSPTHSLFPVRRGASPGASQMQRICKERCTCIGNPCFGCLTNLLLQFQVVVNPELGDAPEREEFEEAPGICRWGF